jgi:hypothetical protein
MMFGPKCHPENVKMLKKPPTTARRSIWPLNVMQDFGCAKHKWASEILHTFTKRGLVSLRICIECGSVSRTVKPYHEKIAKKLRK